MRVLVVLIVGLTLPLGGCLRLSYDLCTRDEPHPECDASRPPVDASVSDAGELDAAVEDSGSLDAGADAGTLEDAGSDSGFDAGPDAETFDGGPLDAALDAT